MLSEDRTSKATFLFYPLPHPARLFPVAGSSEGPASLCAPSSAPLSRHGGVDVGRLLLPCTAAALHTTPAGPGLCPAVRWPWRGIPGSEAFLPRAVTWARLTTETKSAQPATWPTLPGGQADLAKGEAGDG